MVKCIVKRGITATIDLKGNKIILEDRSYPLQAIFQADLMLIVNVVIKLSQDEVAKQYRQHTPLFVNSGSALPVAIADIKRAGSVVDDVELDSEHWHLSVMHLSDHHKNQPQDVFLLLEQRNYAGEHIIHQITLDKDKFKVDSHAVNPLEVGNKRETVFGKMSYINTKPRYYGSSFVLSEEAVQKLLLDCTKQASSGQMGDAYKVLHELTARYVDLVQNSNNESSLLSLSWPDYVKQPKVVEYKKDELLKVDVEQVRRHSNTIEDKERGLATQKLGLKTKEEVRVQGKQLKEQNIQLQETRIEVEDQGQQMENLKFGIKEQNVQLQETRVEVEDHKQRIEISEMKIDKHEDQIQENLIEAEKQAQQIETLDFRTKNTKEEQPQEHGKEPQEHQVQINISNKTLEIFDIKEEAIIAQLATVKGIDLELVAGVFDAKTLQKVKERASKGLWKKKTMSLSKDCEKYFKEKYLAASLKNAKVVVNKETILAARIVLFKTMSEAILWSKKPLEAFKCVDEFGKAYPELTKQIAMEYPEYFLDIAIAERCIKDDKNLLDDLKAKLPAKLRW
jgi:hypothetical protein